MAARHWPLRVRAWPVWRCHEILSCRTLPIWLRRKARITLRSDPCTYFAQRAEYRTRARMACASPFTAVDAAGTTADPVLTGCGGRASGVARANAQYGGRRVGPVPVLAG